MAKKRSQSEFYEVMPGAIRGPVELFPPKSDYAELQDELEESAQEQVRGRMIRQGVLLLGLLLLQIILFIALLKATTNLT